MQFCGECVYEWPIACCTGALDNIFKTTLSIVCFLSILLQFLLLHDRINVIDLMNVFSTGIVSITKPLNFSS